MNRLYIIVLVLLIIAIGGGTAWYLTHTRSAAIDQAQQAQVPDTNVKAGQAIYTNGTYGFSVFYPESATVDYSFAPTYHLGSAWRANALTDATGTPVVSFVTYSTESDHSYPRYYHAMVRVGASSDPKEVAGCLKPTSDQGETALPDRTINGTTWKAFSFQNAGMMQYVKGVSYRAVHEGKCIALEQIATGSSYRDDPASADDVADSVLEQEYADLDAIVNSFSFARP